MAKQLKRRLAILSAAVLMQSTLVGLSAQAQSSANSEPPNTVVAVMLNTESVRAAKVEVADEPRVEVLLLRAQLKREVCTADVKRLMEQAYDLIFHGAEIPLGGGEAILLAK